MAIINEKKPTDLKTADFYYDLPERLIAQHPMEKRDTSRLMVIDRESGKAMADLITLDTETVDDSKPYELFDPNFTWKRKVIENYEAKELLEPLFVKGECVFNRKSVKEIQEYCKVQIDTLWDEVLRFENPHKYYVDLSQDLWDIKDSLLKSKK